MTRIRQFLHKKGEKMNKFSAVDYYGLDEELTDEERMSRDMARQFVDKEVIPIIADYFKKAEFPRHLIQKMGELGFFGATLEGYGCAGLSNIAAGILMRELERGDSGLRSFASVQSSLVMYPIYTFGGDAQKEKWLPALARGEAIGCFGLTESEHGSDPGGMATRAQRIDGGFILNGEKMWITNGSLADIAIVWAKLDGTVRGFLVQNGAQGFTAKDIHNKWSMRASVTSSLSLIDCFVPEKNMLPHAEGLRAPLMCLNQARYGIAWGVVGVAMACYDTALSYAKKRIQFGKPIASFQLPQAKLVDMLSEITKAQLLCMQLGKLKDAGRLKHTQVSLAKRNNAKIALDIAREARDMLGAAGITHDFCIGRHMANLETVKTYEGTHDIHTLIIGRDITGISALE